MDRLQMEKIFEEDFENKKQAVLTIGNDTVRKNRMCVPTVLTFAARDKDGMDNNFSLKKIDQIPAIAGKRDAVSCCVTDGTDFFGGRVVFHTDLKKRSRGFSDAGEFAKKAVFSYHRQILRSGKPDR